MLHHLPPPDTTVRHRHGYEQLDDHEAVDEPTGGNDPDTPSGDDEDATEREVVEHDGWRSLIWSFLASAVLAVRINPYTLRRYLTDLLQFAAFFFPVIFAIPILGDHIARQWLWFFTPSLSYVGQGKFYYKLSIHEN